MESVTDRNNPENQPTLYFSFFGNHEDSVNNKNCFFLQELNDTLGLTIHTLLDIVKEIPNGIKATEEAIDIFSKKNYIDKKTSKKIIHSWSEFLKENYNKLEIKACLKRKLEKYPEYSNYAIVKNNNAFPNILNSAMLKKIVDEFIQNGDIAGYNCIKKIKGFFQRNIILSIFNNLFFRKVSKLAVSWSEKENIPLKFFISVDLDENKIDKENYQRIPLSEYRFIKKNNFEHVLFTTDYISSEQCITDKNPLLEEALTLDLTWEEIELLDQIEIPGLNKEEILKLSLDNATEKLTQLTCGYVEANQNSGVNVLPSKIRPTLSGGTLGTGDLVNFTYRQP